MPNDNQTLDQRVYDMAQVLSAIKQQGDDLHSRLFVDGGGILPVMFSKVTTLEQELAKKASAQVVVDLSTVVATKADAKDLSALREKRAYHIGYAAGAGSVATLALKYLASKVGIHF
jgi:hypothetical protein